MRVQGQRCADADSLDQLSLVAHTSKAAEKSMLTPARLDQWREQQELLVSPWVPRLCEEGKAASQIQITAVRSSWTAGGQQEQGNGRQRKSNSLGFHGNQARCG